MTLPAEFQNLGQQLQTLGGQSHNKGDVNFMKFSNGEFSFGKDNLEPQEGSIWGVHPHQYLGYIAWPDQAGAPLAEHMARANEPPIVLANLGPAPSGSRNGWVEQRAIHMVCLNGEDKGTQVLLKSGGTMGGNDAIVDLLNAVRAEFSNGSTKIVAEVTLDTDSYYNKKYGKDIVTPKLTIVGWREVESDESVADEPVDTATVIADTPPDSEPAPTRQRRRPVS